jgi:tripartite ATP-independent transporter DctM subunit
MEAAGLAMLATVAIALVITGLPAFIVLIGTALAFALLGMATGDVPLSLLTALPLRLVGLLENDLLQALPLYVLMGALLNRLPLAERVFRTASRTLAFTRAGPALAGVLLGALLAPMNGSVGAAVATLARVVHPRLRASHVAASDAMAITAAASTLGVIVPPSLVLILFGDAMMRAHTEAQLVTHGRDRIMNTQDVFHGALVPAGLFLLACLAIAWWRTRTPSAPAAPGSRGEAFTALVTIAFVAGLLAAVTTGWLYAVEAAATGAVGLFAYGLATRTLDRAALDAVLRTTMEITGSLFALFVAATTFTLVLRGFGTDRLLTTLIAAIPFGAPGATAAVLLLLAACALVLDAFEIILVVIPIVMPPLLVQAPDAVWAGVLAMLALQASFLIPPVGYAIMMARTRLTDTLPFRRLLAALAPFLVAQLAILALCFAVPALVHLVGPGNAPMTERSSAESGSMLNNMLPASEPEDP